MRDLILFFKGLWHGWTCGNPNCECRVEGPRGVAVAIGGTPNYDHYPDAPKILQRFPKYPLGVKLRWRGVVGGVYAIHADYNAAMPFASYSPEFYEVQKDPPSSQDQVFYSLLVTIEHKGRRVATGTVIAGENDVELEGREG
jgi:hypothetical protein